MKQMTSIINIAEMGKRDWVFVKESYTASEDDWGFFVKGAASSFLERRISRPDLSRYANCLRGVATARGKKDPVIISHLPKTTLYAEIFKRLLRLDCRHIAFSFNFTTLPTGIEKAMMSTFLNKVYRIVVFSEYEKIEYPRYFGIDQSRFQFCHWCMNVPQHDSLDDGQRYVCAVGGEGRNHGVVLDAARRFKDLQFRIVGRPGAIGSRDAPDNVEILTNVDAPRFWTIVANSLATIVSLTDERRCCGHISTVGSMRLGVPVVASCSLGLADYVADGKTALLFPPGDADGLENCVGRLVENATLRRSLAEAALDFSSRFCDEANWAETVRRFVHE